MKKIVVMCASLLASVSAFAALEPLDNQALASVDGQAGGALALELDLRLNAADNGTPSNPLDDRPLTAAGELCAVNPVACRLALRVNTNAATPQSWLVLKGLSLSLRIPELLLETTDVMYNAKTTNTPTYVSGVKASLGNSAGTLTYSGGKLISNTKPLGINLSVESISFENNHRAVTGGGTYVGASVTNNNGVVSGAAPTLTGGTAGGTGTGAYGTDGRYTAAAGAFDQGKEVGFLGLAIKGNIAMNGSVTTFACTGTHPRC